MLRLTLIMCHRGSVYMCIVFGSEVSPFLGRYSTGSLLYVHCILPWYTLFEFSFIQSLFRLLYHLLTFLQIKIRKHYLTNHNITQHHKTLQNITKQNKTVKWQWCFSVCDIPNLVLNRTPSDMALYLSFCCLIQNQVYNQTPNTLWYSSIFYFGV